MGYKSLAKNGHAALGLGVLSLSLLCTATSCASVKPQASTQDVTERTGELHWMLGHCCQVIVAVGIRDGVIERGATAYIWFENTNVWPWSDVRQNEDGSVTFECMLGNPGKAVPLTWHLSLSNTSSGYTRCIMKCADDNDPFFEGYVVTISNPPIVTADEDRRR